MQCHIDSTALHQSSAATLVQPAAPPVHRVAPSVKVCAQAIRSDACQRFDVFWCVDMRHQGLFRVTIDIALAFSAHDARIVAELAAMQHLLERRQALGTLADIHKTTLVFTTGAPGRLINGTSSKTHLYPYAYFLTLRFKGAMIVTEKDGKWMTLSALKHLAELHVCGPTGECLHLPGIGPVWLTRHLMRQFRMRLNNQPYQQAWQELERILTRCRLQPLPISTHTVAHDRQHHRHTGLRYYDPSSHWVFVIVQEGSRSVLATAYIQSNANRATSLPYIRRVPMDGGNQPN